MLQNSTSLGKVDLTQDPTDFAKLATGEVVVEEPTKEPAVEKSPVDHPQDNAEQKPADEPKTEKVEPPKEKLPPEQPVSQEKQDQSPGPQKLTPDEFRKREADKMIQRQSEEKKRAMLAHVEAARLNPDHLHTIAKVDKKLANEVVQQVWGYKDYEELIQQAKIAEMKETDPERAEVEARIARLEADQRASAKRTQEQLERAALKSKGIEPNEMDPVYLKIQENLSLLNPQLVQEDYAKALDIAYEMAFGGGSAQPKKVEMQEALNRQLATPSPAASGIKEPMAAPSGYAEHQLEFAGLVGAKLT